MHRENRTRSHAPPIVTVFVRRVVVASVVALVIVLPDGSGALAPRDRAARIAHAETSSSAMLAIPEPGTRPMPDPRPATDGAIRPFRPEVAITNPPPRRPRRRHHRRQIRHHRLRLRRHHRPAASAAAAAAAAATATAAADATAPATAAAAATATGGRTAPATTAATATATATGVVGT